LAEILTIAGLALAWLGLKLTWETWRSLSDGDSTPGFDVPEAKLFMYALIVVTVLGVVYAVRPWKLLSIALTLGACVLIGIAARVALDLYGTGGTFVADHPALGLWVSAAGAVVLIVAAKPVPYALAAGLVPLLALALWPVSGPGAGRLDPVVTKVIGETMTLDGDTVLAALPDQGQQIVAFDPDGERSRVAFDPADAKSGFVEDTNGLALQGDVLYASVTNTGLLRIPLHGKPQLVAEGPVAHPDGRPAGHPMHIPGFQPSRLAAAPDGSVYVLSRDHVYRLRAEQARARRRDR
jgi:hypothetical protein